MEKHIPYAKLSKKEKRKLDKAKRGTWGSLNPVTRKPQNSKAYNRSKARNWKRDHHDSANSGSFVFYRYYVILHCLRQRSAYIIITMQRRYRYVSRKYKNPSKE